MSSSSWKFVVGLVAVLVLVVLLGGDPNQQTGDPLAADATGPRGAKGTVELLRELGAEVVTDEVVPGPGSNTALLLQDRLDDDQRDELVDWIEDGNTLVVADIGSPLTPRAVSDLSLLGVGDPTIGPDACDIDQLDEVGVLSPGDGARFEIPDGTASCYGDDEVGYVIEAEVGDGRLFAVGGVGPFTNERLDQEDNAVLVAQLLAPEPSEARVSFLDPYAGQDAGEGDEALADLLPRRVSMALLQLAIAFVAYAWFRARRAGLPVVEPQPTTLAGSELVAAVGELRQQEKAPERSAAILREDLHRTLSRRLGLSPDAPVEELVAVAERAGADPERLRSVLAGPPVTDGDDLTRLAREIDLTRQEVLHEQP